MTIAEFGSSLFEIRIVGHVAHLQTTSYAQHKALDELYNGVVEYADRILETYQGIHGIVKGYPSFNVIEGKDMVTYLKDKVSSYRKVRTEIKEEEIKAIIDELIEFLNSIIYKLVNLK